MSDAKIRTLLKELDTRMATAEQVDAAAAMYLAPAPGQVVSTARWLNLFAELSDLGPAQQLDVLTLAYAENTGAGKPEAALVEQILERAGETGRDWALRTVASAQTNSSFELPASIAAAMLADGHAAPDSLLRFALRWTTSRSNLKIVSQASPSARATWLLTRLNLATVGGNHGYAKSRLASVLPLLHLFAADEAVKAELEPAVKLLEREAEHAELVAHLRSALAGNAVAPKRNEADIAEAIRYAKNEFHVLEAAVKARTSVPAAIEAAEGRSVRVKDAAELLDIAAWKGAKPSRRKALAERIAKAFGNGLMALPIKKRNGLPIARFQHAPTDTQFVLVVGGTFEMGFSETEEKTLRAAADENKGIENWEEEFGMFLQSLGSMRPLRKVSVGPFLTTTGPGAELPYPRISDVLEDAPFRLLSEAEWEYAARGGVAGELTPSGNEIPERPKRFFNRFGLRSLGALPELCADAYFPSYDGAPTNAAPRRGEGPRVVRGGAALIYPWQACGEWQLLCNATRATNEGWNLGVSLRLSVGIEVT